MEGLTKSPITRAQDNTAPVEHQYFDTVTIHNREFQSYSVDHLIHLVPIDEASDPEQFEL